MSGIGTRKGRDRKEGAAQREIDMDRYDGSRETGLSKPRIVICYRCRSNALASTLIQIEPLYLSV